MRRVAALLSALALVVAGLVVTAGASSANGPALGVGGLPSAGDITIKTGLSRGAGEVVYTDVNGATAVQAVSNNTCDALAEGALVLSADGGACYRNLGFGVGSGRDGLPWYQEFLNPNTKSGEVLALGLNLPDTLFLGEVSLDLEAVGTGAGDDVSLTAFLGDEVVQTIGFDLADPVVSVPPNYRVTGQVTAAADRLELTALGDTRFQLEGDTNNRQGSTFSLARVTDVVPCEGGTAEAGGATLTITGGEGCTAEPVVFEREGNELTLLKNPSDLEFRVTVPWDVEASAYPVPVTTIDYFDGAGDQDMVVCGGTTADPSLPGDQIPSTGAEDGWCVAGQGFELTGGDTMQVTEVLYGKGDPRFNRL